MKWKRSRKAQQESKNKDKESSNDDNKRERSSSTSSQNSSSFKNEKVITNLAPNNFHLPPHSAIPNQRHLMPGSSKDVMQSNGEENYANNLQNYTRDRPHQSNIFNENDDMIWRVV